MAIKLEKIEGSENYQAVVVSLPSKQTVQGLDRLVKVTVFGNDVLISKDSNESIKYIFFPVESTINLEYLRKNNEFRDANLNQDRSKVGFYEPTARVKCIKFKGVISSGYLAPLDSLGYFVDVNQFKLGDEFNSINGIPFCTKYKVTRTQGSGTKESRFNKKLKRFDRLVPNQFRFHQSTPPLAKCISHIQPDDTIVITDKFHGTSAVFANVLVKRKLTWKDKVAGFFGVKVEGTKYDILYSSRSVLKNS